MTRQRLREGFIKWETNLSLESFALKIVKKSEMLSFTDKVKSVTVKIPEKVKIFIDDVLKKEIKYFKNKFKIDIKFVAEPEYIIPEYSINLFNKNKKIISKTENVNTIQKSENDFEDKKKKTKKIEKKSAKTTLAKIKKIETKKERKKMLRTLWVRRKKKAA